MLSRAEKEQQISEVSSHFKKSNGNFVIGFQGMNVEQMTTLRNELREKQAQMKVIRNTLMTRALSQHPQLKEAFSDSLSGVNAFVFSFGDAGETAKILSNCSEDTEILKLKKAVIGEEILSAKDIQRLAALPSLNELRAQMLALMQAPAGSFVRVLNEVGSSFVRALSAGMKKKQ